MSDRDALIAAILANPDEDTPRLALADWLQENGDAPRAEFVRVQIELSRQRAAEADLPETFGKVRSGRRGGWPYEYRPHDADARRDLLGREAQLVRIHGDEWLAGLPHYAITRQVRGQLAFRRGFVGHVSAALGALMKAPAALWEHHPVESLALEHYAGAARHKVPTCRPLAGLRELFLHYGTKDEAALDPYAECPHLSGLRALRMEDFSGLTLDGARSLARSPHLRPVELAVNCHGLPEEGFAALLNGPFAARLRRFRPANVGPWGANVLADAPLGELRLLDLSRASGGDEGVAALTRSKHLTQLVTLDLGGRPNLTDAGLEALAAWPGLASVRSLNLGPEYHRGRRGVTARGIAALVRSPYLRPIHLGLRNTDAGHESAKALAAWPGLAEVVHLDLRAAGLGDAAALALADAPHWRDVRCLDLAHGQIGPDALARLERRLGKGKVDTRD